MTLRANNIGRMIRNMLLGKPSIKSVDILKIDEHRACLECQGDDDALVVMVISRAEADRMREIRHRITMLVPSVERDGFLSFGRITGELMDRLERSGL